MAVPTVFLHQASMRETQAPCIETPMNREIRRALLLEAIWAEPVPRPAAFGPKQGPGHSQRGTGPYHPTGEVEDCRMQAASHSDLARILKAEVDIHVALACHCKFAPELSR